MLCFVKKYQLKPKIHQNEQHVFDMAAIKPLRPEAVFPNFHRLIF